MLLIAAAILTLDISACSKKDNGGTAAGPQAPVVGDMSHRATGLSAGTTYYWKFNVDDGKGGTAESAVRSFRAN